MKIKIKTPRELKLMIDEAQNSKNWADLFNYIDLLHSKLKSYQNVIDHVTDNNEHLFNQ